MRLHRVHVEDFRGIHTQEVPFAETGVTVVEAPNEAGKTSLLEGIKLVFDYKDGSNAQPVRDVQPVGRDVGSLVEVELTCGEYRLTCRKRFHRQRKTELEITAPEHEQHTGDEAHERLQKVLDTHLDRSLLDALWFEQGRSLRKVVVGESWSLGRALDTAAGASSDAAVDDLFAAVRAEFEAWFTPRAAQPKAHLKSLDEQVAKLEEQENDLTARLERLHVDIERSATLDRDLARIRARRQELEPAVTEYRRQLEAVTELFNTVRRQQELEELERVRRDTEQTELDRRAALEQELADARKRLETIDEELASEASEAERLEREHERLTAAREEADEAAQQARQASRRCHDDVEIVEAKNQLAAHRRVQEAIAAADAAAHDAEAFLAACALTDNRLETIDEAHQQLRLAEAQLEAGAPTVTVEALEPFTLGVDDELRPLTPGSRHEVSTPDPTRLSIGDLASVEVRPGASLGELTEARRKAQALLTEACEAAAVGNRAEAHRVAAQRRDAESTVAGRDQRVLELLGEQTRESLAQEIRQLETWVEGQEAARPDDPPMPAALDEAKSRRAEATTALEAAEHVAEEERAAVDALGPSLTAARTAVTTQRATRAEVVEQLETKSAELARAREHQPDDALVAARDQHEVNRRTAERKRDEAQAELDVANHERVELLAHNAEKQLRDLDQQLEEYDRERTEVRARLRAHGEEGLGEQLADTQAQLERARQERDRDWRHAHASKLLHEVMSDERERAQAAYRQPLSEAIKRLGKLVYNETFAVRLADDLSVAERTLDGDTLTWQQLSGGAQEQLGILSALACGSLIDEGGAPLILDDVLGYTDPNRLERMGAVLATVGQHCQVIVLTCMPDRYRHVGGATIRRLQPAPGSSSIASAPSEPEPEHLRTTRSSTAERSKVTTTRRPHRCRLCGQEGHNARTCSSGS